MAIYSGCFQTTVAGSGAPSCDWMVTSATYAKLMEYGANNGAATACVYGFGRSTNTPTQTSTSVCLCEDAGNTVASKTTWAATWSTAPTITTYARRMLLPATIGSGMVFTFPRGYTLLNAGSWVQWNITASSAVMNNWAVMDE